MPHRHLPTRRSSLNSLRERGGEQRACPCLPARPSCPLPPIPVLWLQTVARSLSPPSFSFPTFLPHHLHSSTYSVFELINFLGFMLVITILPSFSVFLFPQITLFYLHCLLFIFSLIFLRLILFILILIFLCLFPLPSVSTLLPLSHYSWGNH